MLQYNIVTHRGVRAMKIMDSRLDDCIYWHFDYNLSPNYNQYSTITDLHNLQSTVTHALGFSVFTSCLLVMELKQSHCD
jgi:hypothetical protein